MPFPLDAPNSLKHVGGRALGVLLRAYLNLTRQISVRSGKALLAERMEGKAPDPAVSSPTQ